jgi:hypothetical protein
VFVVPRSMPILKLRFFSVIVHSKLAASYSNRGLRQLLNNEKR